MKKMYFMYMVLLSNLNPSRFFVLAAMLMLSICDSYGQIRVPLTPRTSNATPGMSIYQVKGDFTMIGNTNHTLEIYDDNEGNGGNNMIYVDIDNTAVSGNDTFNSSSAYLDFSTENGAIPECSNIVFAGLYWTGKSDDENPDDNADGDNDSNTFQVTKNGITKTLDKRKVLIKGPNTTTYTELTANDTDIYFPDGVDDNMYSAYTEVTDYVIENGIGDYFVADIATIEGFPPDGTGFFGGWGLVVIYENSKMNWRSITVFDGHALVGEESLDYVINTSGFYAVQNGVVNLKLGLIAGEGDTHLTGDYFSIERRNSGTYERLRHANNRRSNFFNSTILTGGNAKNPNLVNNTGIDIVMFNIDNTGNAIIDNNQTATSFRYGTGGETFIIMNVTYAVDTYVPEIGGDVNNTAINGSVPNATNNALDLGNDADYTIEIRNTGTEAVNNSLITIPLPDYLNADNVNISHNLYAPLTTTNSTPIYDATIGANGAIIWDIGTLPIPAMPDDILADLSFTLTLTTDCQTINDLGSNPSVALNGVISGTGNISNVSYTTDLIQGYVTNGTCIGEPIYGSNLIPINYTSNPPTASNPSNLNVQCVGDVPAPDISVVSDASSDYGTVTVAFVNDIYDGNTCPETITRTYRVTDTCNAFIDVTQNIIINDTTPPVVNNPFGDLDASLLNSDTIGITIALSMVPTATDNCSTITLNDVSDNTVTDSSCTGSYLRTRIWNFTDECGNTSENFTQLIYVNDINNPIITTPIGSLDVTLECNDATGLATALALEPTATDISGIATINEVSDTTVTPNLSCPSNYIRTRVWNFTDGCNTSPNFTQTITVQDTTPPVIDNAPEDLDETIECTDTVGLANALALEPTATDNCSAPTINTINVVNDIVNPVAGCSSAYVQTRVWNFTDACGNTSPNFTQTITVTDNTPPSFVEALPPSTLTVECDNVPDTEDIALTATDSCGTASVTVSDVTTNGSCDSNYTIARTWTATNACGNTTAHTQTITVQDTTAPMPTSSFDTTLNVSCTEIPEAPELEFTDNCSTDITIAFEETNTFDENVLADYEINRTWTVSDACNNEAVYTQTLFVTLDEIVDTVIARDRCYDEGIVDLNDLIDNSNSNGIWKMIEGDPIATLSSSGIFDPTAFELNEAFLPYENDIYYLFRYTQINDDCLNVTDLIMNINADCVTLPCSENDVEVSKVMTINGDGRNEFFTIQDEDLCGFIYNLKIFNRWGAVVFESNDYQNDWNGTANAKSFGSNAKLPNGTYYYVITLNDNSLNPFTGSIYLGTK